MHEIALHHNQSPADFQPPFPQETFTSGVSAKEAVGPAHIGALGECLTATHGILDTILSVPLDTLLTLPVIFCRSSHKEQNKSSIADFLARCTSNLRNCMLDENVGVGDELW